MKDLTKLLFLLLLIAAAASCEKKETEITDSGRTHDKISETNVKTGSLRVKMQKGFTVSDTSMLHTKASGINILSMKRTFPYCGKFEKRTHEAGLDRWYDIKFDKSYSLTKASETISDIDGVEQIETIPKIKITGNSLPFDDPDLSDQWQYENTGSKSFETAGADINLFDAWTLETGDPSVIVAVVDGGVDYSHEDLAANMWINQAEYNGTKGVDDDGNGVIDDIYGYNTINRSGTIIPGDHGTHVAGTIAAVNNNGIGVCGVAGGNGNSNSGVRLMSCQVFDNNDDDQGNVPAAIKYAADNGAVICQNSWGYDNPSVFPESVKDAIDYFTKYAGTDEYGNQSGPMKGGIVIFAAGNDNSNENALCNYDKVMSVASIAPNYKKAYYSNYGTWVKITATGGDQKLSATYGGILSTVTNNRYAYYQGTSMACPHVSGVAALAVSYLGGAGFTNDMLWNRLVSSANDIIYDYNTAYAGMLGSGLIDAYKTLIGSSSEPPEKISDLELSARSNHIYLSWKIPEDPDNDKAYGYNIYYSDSPLDGYDLSNITGKAFVKTVKTGKLSAGDIIRDTLSGLEFNTKYYIRIDAFDYSRNHSGLCDQQNITTGSNTPPVIEALNGTNISVKSFGKEYLKFLTYDPDGHDISMAFVSDNRAAYAKMSGDTITVSISGPLSDPGTYHATITVTDSYGSSTVLKITYTVLENRPPEVVAVPDNVVLNGSSDSKTINLAKYIRDPDGELLKFNIISSYSGYIANAVLSDSLLTITPRNYGETTFTISGSDAKGKKASVSFKLLYRNGKKDVEAYPNPVKETLYLRTGSEKEIHVTIFGISGNKKYDKDITASPFSPGKIDVSTYDAGTYTIVINDNGTETKSNIVKI